jgi:APA family basic amino acid/polyamine antiporter
VPELRQAANAGQASAEALFGGFGGRLVAGFVLVSILGTLNATVLVGPRIAYAMALDGLFFRGVDRVHATYRTPTIAILLQALTAIAILALLRTFPSALDFTTFAILLAAIADVAALYALRRSQPGRSRPYRAWGYPWVPALYLASSAFVAGVLLRERTHEAATAVVLLLAALPVYAVFSRRRS